MRHVAVLLRWRLRVAAKLVRAADARLAVACAFLAVFAGLMGAEFLVLRQSFRAMAIMGVAAPPLTLYALETFFVLILVLGVSAVVTGSSVFFRLTENRLLLATPVPLPALFVLRGLETVGLTSWAFVILAAPALAALGVHHARAAGFYAASGLLLLGFLVFTGALGILLTMLFGAALGHFRSRGGIVGLTVGLLAVAGLLVGRSVVPTRADFNTMFEPALLNGTTIALHFVEEKFARWPSHPFAAAVFGLATGQGSDPGRALLLSGLLPVAAAVAALGAGGVLFRRVVWRAAEGVLLSHAEGEAARRPAGWPRFPVVLRGPVGALVEKELVTLARSPQEIGRAAFFAFLLALYTLLFLRVPVPDVAGTEELTARLVAFSVLATGYFLTTMALRFVFPALSLEGRAAWILFASPVPLVRLFWTRLGLYGLAGFLGFGSIALVGGVRLGLSAGGLAALALLLGVLSGTITAVALGLGVCWPDFRGRSAEALATSAGGLLTTAVCLAYVAACGWLAYRLVLALLTGAPPGAVAGPLAGAIGLSLAVAAGPLWLARRRHATLEVR